MVLGSVVAIVGVVAALTIIRREKLPPITLDDVNAAAERWAKNGPADYDLDLEQTGVNPGQVHVEARHNEVTAMTLNGHPTRQHLWDDWSVPGMLGIIRRDVEVCMPELSKKAQQPAAVDAQNSEMSAPEVFPRGLFEPHYGYPMEYHRITSTGADANWRMLKFEAK
jgi:hypothetical protein